MLVDRWIIDIATVSPLTITDWRHENYFMICDGELSPDGALA